MYDPLLYTKISSYKEWIDRRKQIITECEKAILEYETKLKELEEIERKESKKWN